MSIWREPAEESIDLYPGLTVHDGRQTGSITAARSRLPLWAFAGWPWEEVVANWGYIEDEYGWTEERQREFLYHLLNLRGEFARLLLVMADAERCETAHGRPWQAWWETRRHRRRVSAQLRRCLDALDAE